MDVRRRQLRKSGSGRLTHGAECLLVERRRRRREGCRRFGGQRDKRMPGGGGEQGRDTPDPDRWSEWTYPGSVSSCCTKNRRQQQRNTTMKPDFLPLHTRFQQATRRCCFTWHPPDKIKMTKQHECSIGPPYHPTHTTQTCKSHWSVTLNTQLKGSIYILRRDRWMSDSRTNTRTCWSGGVENCQIIIYIQFPRTTELAKKINTLLKNLLLLPNPLCGPASWRNYLHLFHVKTFLLLPLPGLLPFLW